jgi:hypothetical protein
MISGCRNHSKRNIFICYHKATVMFSVALKQIRYEPVQIHFERAAMPCTWQVQTKCSGADKKYLALPALMPWTHYISTNFTMQYKVMLMNASYVCVNISVVCLLWHYWQIPNKFWAKGGSWRIHTVIIPYSLLWRTPVSPNRLSLPKVISLLSLTTFLRTEWLAEWRGTWGGGVPKGEELSAPGWRWSQYSYSIPGLRVPTVLKVVTQLRFLHNTESLLIIST